MSEPLLDDFRNAGAILSGHFVLSSGLHSDTYVQCAKVMEHPETAEKLCRALAERCPDKVDVVVGPAFGGILVGYELARALGARSIFFERVDGTFQLRRGFEISKGERVVVAEDVVTTGGSAREVVDLIEKEGGEVVAVTALVDRGGSTVFGKKFRSLVTVKPPLWEPADCPLCREGKATHKPGSRK